MEYKFKHTPKKTVIDIIADSNKRFFNHCDSIDIYKYIRNYNLNENYNNIFNSEKDKVIKLYNQYLIYKYGSEFPYLQYCDYVDHLNEGLIMSLGIEDFKYGLEKIVNKQNIDIIFKYPKQANGITPSLEIILLLNDYNKVKDNLISSIKKFGYIIFLEKEINNYKYIYVEPKFIVDATDFIYRKGELYHITLAKRYNKIKNTGLIPKSSKKTILKYEDKIYFFFHSPDKNKFIQEAKDLYLIDDKDGKYIDSVNKNYYLNENGKLDIVVLKIDLTKIRKVTNLKVPNRFFFNPNVRPSVFTYEPVHPELVDIYCEFEI